MAMLLPDALCPLQLVEALVGPITILVERAPSETGLIAWLTLAAILAGQEPSPQGVVGDDAHALISAQGNGLQLLIPEHHVVQGLHGAEACEVVLVADPEGLAELPRREVGAANVQDLALMHQVI